LNPQHCNIDKLVPELLLAIDFKGFHAEMKHGLGSRIFAAQTIKFGYNISGVLRTTTGLIGFTVML
jgi:hypothetical protein